VPLITLSSSLSESVLLELHTLGSDDVVGQHDLPGLTRRLAALSSFDPSARTAVSFGTCLLGHSDPYRRQVLGRVLRQAGFDVVFAADPSEAATMAQKTSPKVAVVSELVFPPHASRALESLSGSVPTVLLTRAARSTVRGVTPVQEDAPPDALLFAVNELLRPRELIEARASRRLLYATPCTFRSAGDLECRVGLTYNISREGLYVRTFDALSSGQKVWVELRPPNASAACHLRGDVMWARTLATGAYGATPPGFGVRLALDKSPPEDRALYVKYYEALLAELAVT